MPAYAEEIEEALHEGVKLSCLTQPVEIMKNPQGKVEGLKCLPQKLGEFDRSGRRRPQDAEDKPIIIEADQVIIAIGQRLDTVVIKGGTAPGLNTKNFITINPQTGQTDIPWIFSGGDAVTGPASVVEAIASGEHAAVGIDLFLSGENHAFWREEKDNDTAYDPDADPVPYTREKMPLLDVERRRANFDEVELCWTESVAMRQSVRCLRCDYGKKTVSYNTLTREDING